MLRKELFGIVIFAVVLGSIPLLLLPGLLPYNDNLTLGEPQLQKFQSYYELLDFLNRSHTPPPYYYPPATGGLWRTMPVFAALEDASSAQSVDYSKTNIQVEGVDEADIVKCDGEYIYIASNNRVLIIRAYPPQQAELVCRVDVNGTILGIFVNESKLVVFTDGFSRAVYIPETVVEFRTVVKIYDIEDKSEPVLYKEISVDGYYFNSRMIQEHIYLLTTYPALIREEIVPLPAIRTENKTEVIEPTDIYYSDAEDYYHSFTTVASIDIQTGELIHETFLVGSATCLYVSQNNIYVAMPKYEDNTQKTEIHRIRITDGAIDYEASGEVPGYVLNQFSMDEHNEHFRIATTLGQVARTFEQATSANNVYVLKLNLTIVGRLENLAPGESIYSARFMGDRCYLVTFKKVDPLFVIDLGDPANPEILGKLKIPGYSDYLHPYDENHLIGIGKETVEAEEGDFAWYQGVKISIFDVSDVENPIETAKFEIGDRGTDSPILWDHKALLFDKERNLLAIPVLVAEIDEEKYPEGAPPYTHGDYVWQGAYVFNITENSITLRGGITHVEDDSDLLKSGYYFYSEHSIKRTLYIEDFLYTISDKNIKMNNLTTLQEVNEIELP
ncbi:MAG: beta-propeller domain-containing protein [Candidatus Bathyarchaeia archaeon]